MNKILKISISNQFRNTSMGLVRIKKNLNIFHLSDNEIECYLKKVILSTSIKNIETKGKNYYFKSLNHNAILTINSHTFTVITAKQINKKKHSNMTKAHMSLIVDKYDGITIDNSTIPNDVKEFEKELANIIENRKDKKLLWVKIPIQKAYIIPLLTKYNFVFHHCNEKDITMLKKLIDNPIVPTAINHTLGVGAVVIKDNKLLVIKDKIWKKYKLPGGYIDDKENISQALQREVFEETGIKIELESIVSLGHFFPSQFGQSNLYVLCCAKALSFDINIVDTDEIIEAKWMEIDEYMSCEDIHIYNKNIVKTAMKNRGLKLETDNCFTNVDNQHEYYF